MDLKIITEAPSWLALFCAVAGILAALLLYRRNRSLQEIAPGTVLLMAILRFLSVTLISFLLLSPLIRTIFNEVEKPILIFLQDGSSSVAGNADSLSVKKEFSVQLKELVSELDGEFEVRTFTIGDKVREGLDGSYSDKQTDLSAAVPELKARFSGRNTGAVILVSWSTRSWRR